MNKEKFVQFLQSVASKITSVKLFDNTQQPIEDEKSLLPLLQENSVGTTNIQTVFSSVNSVECFTNFIPINIDYKNVDKISSFKHAKYYEYYKPNIIETFKTFIEKLKKCEPIIYKGQSYHGAFIIFNEPIRDLNKINIKSIFICFNPPQSEPLKLTSSSGGTLSLVKTGEIVNVKSVSRVVYKTKTGKKFVKYNKQFMALTEFKKLLMKQ